MHDSFREKIWRFAARHFEMLFFLAILLVELIVLLLSYICWLLGMVSDTGIAWIIGAILAGDLAGILFWILE